MVKILNFDGEVAQMLKKEFPYPRKEVSHAFESQKRLKEIYKRRFIKPEYIINRFPLMVALGYCVAQKYGFSEILSRLLGYGIARYYAIMKNVGLGRTRARLEGKLTLDDQLVDDRRKFEYIDFCGAEFIKDPHKDELLGIASIRGYQQSITLSNFEGEKSKLDALKGDGFEWICSKIRELIKNEDLGIKAPYGARYFAFWKKIRDNLRTKEYWR